VDNKQELEKSAELEGGDYLLENVGLEDRKWGLRSE
jgi:hypothetical protein